MSLCPHNTKIPTHLLPHGRSTVQNESVLMAERQCGGGKKNASTPVQAPASVWLFLVIPHGFRHAALYSHFAGFSRFLLIKGVP